MSAQTQSRPSPVTGLVFTEAARQVCQALGTTAWAALADVALDARPDHQDRLVAATNVRRIAEHLGISRDTAARALARLADAGLVVRRAGQRSAGGTFAPSAYELRIASDVNLTFVAAPTTPVSHCPVLEDSGTKPAPASGDVEPDGHRADRIRPRSRRRPRTSRPEQPALFEPADQAASQP